MAELIEKIEKLEQRAEKYLLRMFNLFKGLREAVAKKDKKRAKKFQRWEGLYERREWRSYNKLVSKLNKLRKDLPEAEQKIIDDIEEKLEINEKKLADELSRRAGEVKKHLKAEDWDALDKEMEEIETTIKSIEAIFENELEPELVKLEKRITPKLSRKEITELYQSALTNPEKAEGIIKELGNFAKTRNAAYAADALFKIIRGMRDIYLRTDAIDALEKVFKDLDPREQKTVLTDHLKITLLPLVRQDQVGLVARMANVLRYFDFPEDWKLHYIDVGCKLLPATIWTKYSDMHKAILECMRAISKDEDDLVNILKQLRAERGYGKISNIINAIIAKRYRKAA